MEELLEILYFNDLPDPQHLTDSSSDEEVMLSCSSTAATPANRRTMRLRSMQALCAHISGLKDKLFFH